MKLCLVTGEFPPMQGGVGDFTNELGKALAELGVEVSIVTPARIATYRQVLRNGLQPWRMQ